MLSDAQKQFIFKRTMFQKISGYLAWSIGLSSSIAWGFIFWFKPEMVNPQAVLALLKTKTDNGVNMTQVTDLAILAVTGATAISALFFFVLLMSFVLYSSSKKEQEYLSIIEHLEKQQK